MYEWKLLMLIKVIMSKGGNYYYYYFFCAKLVGINHYKLKRKISCGYENFVDAQKLREKRFFLKAQISRCKGKIKPIFNTDLVESGFICNCF